MKKHLFVGLVTLLSYLVFGGAAPAAQESEKLSTPIVSDNLVFDEVDGVVAVEAEHFFKQTHVDKRRWYITTAKDTPQISPDGDPPHVRGAGGGAYLEILPDTRRTHGEKLIHGENFSNEPGKRGVLYYKVNFNTPGRYYVWARTYSTGTEDNGLHVGIDGTWPASGQRMQWTAKRQWFWDSKQRTQETHTGERYKLYIDVDRPGLHTIMFSMREDGFEFDKWLMTRDREYERPTSPGPKPRVRKGELPKPFPVPDTDQEPT